MSNFLKSTENEMKNQQLDKKIVDYTTKYIVFHPAETFFSALYHFYNFQSFEKLVQKSFKHKKFHLDICPLKNIDFWPIKPFTQTEWHLLIK